MSETNVTWHPCSKERLPESGYRYLVTVGSLVITRTYPFEDWERRSITAWAKLPRPYDKRRKHNIETHWHLFPNEKPDKRGRYLVTARCYRGARFTMTKLWVPNIGWFLKEDGLEIIAWAEMPEPYKEC